MSVQVKPQPRSALPPIDKPITHKFQQWLRCHPRQPRPPALLSGAGPARGEGSPADPTTTPHSPHSARSDPNAGGLLMAVERLKRFSAERGTSARGGAQFHPQTFFYPQRS